MSDVEIKTIEVEIRCFGAISRYLPEIVCIETALNTSVEAVLQQVVRERPEAAALLEYCACAVDTDLIDRSTVLQQSTTLVLLSPVAGG